MIDRSFKICNNWNSFYNDIENMKSNLDPSSKNAYSSFLIDEVIKNYLNHKFCNTEKQLKDKSDVHYFNVQNRQPVTPYQK